MSDKNPSLGNIVFNNNQVNDQLTEDQIQLFNNVFVRPEALSSGFIPPEILKKLGLPTSPPVYKIGDEVLLICEPEYLVEQRRVWPGKQNNGDTPDKPKHYIEITKCKIYGIRHESFGEDRKQICYCIWDDFWVPEQFLYGIDRLQQVCMEILDTLRPRSFN